MASRTETKTQTGVFTGTSRRIDGSSNKLMEPLGNDEKYVLDMHAPFATPREKSIYAVKRSWQPRGSENDLEIGNITIQDAYENARWKKGTIVSTEIHVIYLPHLPVEIYRKYNLEMALEFTGTESEEKVISKAIFPVSLHTHVIFYPGHSFSMKIGSKIPWKITMITAAEVKDDYIAADIVLSMKGYNTPLSQHSDKQGADIISLIPASEVPTGITLTRPRGDKEWIIKSLKHGLRTQKDFRAITVLQEAGVNIEGLQVSNTLKDAIKIVHKLTGENGTDYLSDKIHEELRSATLALLKSVNVKK
uniref:Protein 3 n=1 Tax=Chamaemelum virus 1 TaxID=2977963 RepID=A0A9N7AAZ8_9RHAB|nr:TPA_asm: protein 3 [Chamaemelum virus 1]